MEHKKPPIEVVAICPSSMLISRGTPIRILKLLNGLVEREEVVVRIFSMDDLNPVPGAEHVTLTDNFLNNLKLLSRSLKKKKCNIVIGHTLGSARYLFALRLFCRSTFLLEMHGFTAREARFARKISLLQFWVNSLLHKILFWLCDAITTCSPTATTIISKYNKNTFTVYNGADTSLFHPNTQPKYNFKNMQDDIVIGYAGNVRHYQGLDFLLEAFCVLSKKDSRFKLALLLSRNYDMEEKSEKIKNSYKNVTIIKGLPHKDVPAFLASCDILVVPRPDTEVNRISFASKLLEYMAMGKPVVSSNTSDAGRVITNCTNGILYNPGSQAEFVEAILSLRDEEFRVKLGSNARTLICDKYSNFNTNEHFFSLIKSLVD